MRTALGRLSLAAVATGVTVFAGTLAGAAPPAQFNTPVGYNSGDHPYRVALGDFDQDGDRDVAVTEFQGSLGVRVFENTGAGGLVFANFYPTAQPDEVRVLKVDAGVDPDLVVGTLGAPPQVLMGGAGLTFGPASPIRADGSQARWVEVADLNRDGHPDVVAMRQTAKEVAVYRNVGAAFGEAKIYPGGDGDVAVGQLDRKRPPDVVVGSHNDPRASIMLGRKNGTLRAPRKVKMGVSVEALAIGDLNRDGRGDLVSARSIEGKPSKLTVRLGRGALRFRKPKRFTVPEHGGSGMLLQLARINGDKRPDVLFAPGGASPTVVLHGRKGKALLGKPRIVVPAGAGGLAVGRLNPDKKLDVVTTNFGGPIGKLFVALQG